tara:strand:- start:204 stop:611 length:408 start_codon:yes stop_codon:yes gene_type:complete
VTQHNYFELLEATSKVLGFKKKATAIRLLEKNQSVLEGIGIESAAWLDSVNTFHRHYSVAAGSESSLVHFHRNRIEVGVGVDLKHSYKWIIVVRAAKRLYGTYQILSKTYPFLLILRVRATRMSNVEQVKPVLID